MQLSLSRAPCAVTARSGKMMGAQRASRAVAVRPQAAVGTSFAVPAGVKGVTVSFDKNGNTVLKLEGVNEAAELKKLAGLFDIWNSALQSGDPEKVASLYAPDAILLPTVSNKVRTDHQSKVDYFIEFLKLKPFGTINESHCRFLDEDRTVGIHSGVYTFDITRDGQPQKVQARFSFCYRLIDGQWLITEHHSSAMPEPVKNPLDEVADLFNKWNSALQTGDPEQVAAMYAPDAVLLPTVSNVVRTDHASKVSYFIDFLKLKPFGKILESHVRFLTPDQTVACNSGVYVFDIQKDGQPQKVTARYSYIYKKIGGRWLITEHHSSAMPEPLSEVEQKAAELELLLKKTPAAEYEKPSRHSEAMSAWTLFNVAIST